MAKKKRLKVKNIVIFMILAIAIVVGIFFGIKYIASKFGITVLENKTDAYIGASTYTVSSLNTDFTESENIVRGTKIVLYENPVEEKDEEGNVINTYSKIQYEGKNYLVDPDNVVDSLNEAIFEKNMYVRTSATLYENYDTVDIQGFTKKGTNLEITGFDAINEDGTVNMYKVKNGGNEAYVYSKYLVDNEESANSVYNENGTYDIHKDRAYRFNLHGGAASNLDYYPYEKLSFADNELKAETKTFYLVGTYYVLAEVDKYIALAKDCGATAFVVDIKDGALAYKSDVAKEYSQTSYNNGMNSVEFYGQAIKKIQDAGFYVIGRIVLFNDSSFAKDNPADCILTSGGASTSWVSAYSRNAWEYNVKLALEAIEKFDFNEIQFDYVRFPEASYNWSSRGYNFRNNYDEEKAQAVQDFLFYATDEIHKTNTYVSVDVFGECSSTYVTAYGQYWPAISNIVDVISAMPYVDHFDRTNSNYWYDQYSTVYNWGLTAAARQKEIPTPAKVRTWITAYNVPYWDVAIIEGPEEIAEQIKGLVDAGLGSGFITWNSSSSYDKYKYISSAFSKEY